MGTIAAQIVTVCLVLVFFFLVVMSLIVTGKVIDCHYNETNMAYDFIEGCVDRAP